jgi:N4-gp56 family major capsid protein
VVTEFGNSIPMTRKLKDMSQYEIQQVLRNTLVNDMAKTIDIAVWDKLAATLLVAQASGAGGTDTTNIVLYENGTGTSAVNATGGLSTGHVLSIVDTMKERNIPTFDGESYICVSHPSTLGKIRSSLIATNQYTESGYKKIMSGEIGSFGGVRFIEQTNIGKVTATSAGQGNGWALFVGGEACVEAVAVPEELIEKEVTDYGRSLGLAWYANLGFALPFGTASATNQRAIMWWPNASVPYDILHGGTAH